jgi:phospholipase/carboxylesterase
VRPDSFVAADGSAVTGLERLVHRTRHPAGDPEGILLLLHGRGADENDLFPLFDLLDPRATLLGIAPRAPLSLPPGGAHWYVSREVGSPDPATFRDTFALLEGWLEALERDTGIAVDRHVLAGFSQGAVMSYALALGPGRTRPRALVALSGFMPNVPGFDLDVAGARDLPVAIGHGVHDPVIGVEWGRAARSSLEDAGARVLYQESPMAHSIDPSFLSEVAELLA